MINLLIGKKGSGKTKRLIDKVHEAVQASSGNVVCIELGDTLTYDVDHKARLINVDEYLLNIDETSRVKGHAALYGFLCGLCAGNYDITDILIDSTLKILGRDMADLEKFLKEIEALSEKTSVKFTFSVSADASELPVSLKEFVCEK